MKVKNWLLLRGLGRNKKHWLDLPEMLENAQVNTLFIDLPGFGSERNVPAPTRLEAYTDFLRSRFLEEKKKFNDGPWGIFGLSLGGMITLDWIARYEEDFKSAMICNSSVASLNKTYERLTLTAFKALIKATRKKNIYEREKEVLKVISFKHKDSSVILKRLAEISESDPTDKKSLLKQIFAASQFKAPPKITTPLTVLVGAKDEFVNPICSKKIADYYHAKLITHMEAGHDIPLDDPEWITKQIQSTLVFY